KGRRSWGRAGSYKLGAGNCLRVHLLRSRHRLAECNGQAEDIFGDVFHGAKERHRIEIVEEAEMGDAKDLALHLALAVGSYEAEAGLERLYYVAGVHAVRNSDGSGSGGWGSGREQRESKRGEPSPSRLRIHLRVVDEGDAALFEIAAGLAGHGVERR